MPCFAHLKRTSFLNDLQKRALSESTEGNHVEILNGSYFFVTASEETKTKIKANLDICRHAKKLLELFYEIDLSGEFLTASSGGVDLKRSKPEDFLPYLDAFVAFVKALKRDSYFCKSE